MDSVVARSNAELLQDLYDNRLSCNDMELCMGRFLLRVGTGSMRAQLIHHIQSMLWREMRVAEERQAGDTLDGDGSRSCPSPLANAHTPIRSERRRLGVQRYVAEPAPSTHAQGKGKLTKAEKVALTKAAKAAEAAEKRTEKAARAAAKVAEKAARAAERAAKAELCESKKKAKEAIRLAKAAARALAHDEAAESTSTTDAAPSDAATAGEGSTKKASTQKRQAAEEGEATDADQQRKRRRRNGRRPPPPPTVFVINLARRPDRRERTLGLPWGMAVEVVEAVDGRLMTWDDKDVVACVTKRAISRARDAADAMVPTVDGDSFSEHLTLGAVGCAMSHRKAWAEIARRKTWGVVAEDDVLHLADHFATRLQRMVGDELPANWGMAYLGYHTPQLKVASEGVDVAMRHATPRDGLVTGLYAYALSAKGARLLLRKTERLYTQVDVQVGSERTGADGRPPTPHPCSPRPPTRCAMRAPHRTVAHLPSLDNAAELG